MGRLDKHTKIKIFFLVPSYKQSCLEDKAPDIDSNTQDTEEIPDNTTIIPGKMQQDSGNTQEDSGNTDKYGERHGEYQRKQRPTWCHWNISKEGNATHGDPAFSI